MPSISPEIPEARAELAQRQRALSSDRRQGALQSWIGDEIFALEKKRSLAEIFLEIYFRFQVHFQVTYWCPLVGLVADSGPEQCLKIRARSENSELERLRKESLGA